MSPLNPYGLSDKGAGSDCLAGAEAIGCLAFPAHLVVPSPPPLSRRAVAGDGFVAEAVAAAKSFGFSPHGASFLFLRAPLV